MKKRDKYVELIGNYILSEETDKPTRRLIKFSKNINKRKPISEEWFKEKLHHNKIKPNWQRKPYRFAFRYIQNFACYRYVLDFAFPQYKLLLEIDDISHNKNEKKFKDKIRDEFFLNKGWTIYRIPHGDEKKASEVIEILASCRKLIALFSQSGMSNRDIVLHTSEFIKNPSYAKYREFEVLSGQIKKKRTLVRENSRKRHERRIQGEHLVKIIQKYMDSGHDKSNIFRQLVQKHSWNTVHLAFGKVEGIKVKLPIVSEDVPAQVTKIVKKEKGKLNKKTDISIDTTLKTAYIVKNSNSIYKSLYIKNPSKKQGEERQQELKLIDEFLHKNKTLDKSPK